MVHSTPDFEAMLATLAEHRVEFILVGGVAAVLHGAPVTTFDLDVVHSRDPDNLVRLLLALKEMDAHYRGRGAEMMRPTAEGLSSTGHHLLMTKYGPLDLLGIIGRNRDFYSLLDHASLLAVGELSIHVLNLETLIAVKEELSFEKDLAALPLLRRTLAEKGKKSSSDGA